MAGVPAPRRGVGPRVADRRAVAGEVVGRALRALTALGAGSLAVGTLGLAWVHPSELESGPALTHPRAGDCHRYLSPEEASAVADLTRATPCHQPHSLEVVAILPVPAPIRARRTRPSAEQLRSLQGVVGCSGALVRRYVGGDAIDRHWFVAADVRWPSEAEWAAGVRRARCAAVPSRRDALGRPTWRGSMRQLMHRPASAAIRPCLLGRRMVPCDQEHAVELHGVPWGAQPSRALCELVAPAFLGQRPAQLDLRSTFVEVDGGLRWCGITRVDATTWRGTVAAHARR
jgi:hypothetical protein